MKTVEELIPEGSIVTLPTLAAVLGVSRPTVVAMIARGELPPPDYHIGRERGWKRAALLAALEVYDAVRCRPDWGTPIPIRDTADYEPRKYVASDLGICGG